MRSKALEEQVAEYGRAQQGIRAVYEDYSRSLGVSSTTLHILSAIYAGEGCTQKDLCARTFLPKQTVHSIVTELFRQGYVELREQPEDRRTKSIRLTESGGRYAEAAVGRVHEAEREAMAGLREEARDVLIDATTRFAEKLRALLTSEIDQGP